MLKLKGLACLAVGVVSLFFTGSLATAQDAAAPVSQELESIEDATLDSVDTSQSNLPKTPVDATTPSASETQSDSSANTDVSPTPAAGNSETLVTPAPEAADVPSEETVREEPQPDVPQTPLSDSPTSEGVASTSESDDSSQESRVKGTYGGRIFGRHKIQLAANRPNFNDGQKCYQKFYGKPETHLSFSGEWFPLDWWVNPGLYSRIGVYSVRGKAVSGGPQSTQTVNCESLTVDENSSTSLLFVPIQIGAKIQFSPFRRKWLVLDYWTGGELSWWQETRNETASLRMPYSLASSSQVYTSTGRKRSVSAGASIHLLLNPLDERTVRSMIDTMGIGYVFLSGFMETVKSTTKEGLTFGRNVVGIGFTFEAFK